MNSIQEDSVLQARSGDWQKSIPYFLLIAYVILASIVFISTLFTILTHTSTGFENKTDSIISLIVAGFYLGAGIGVLRFRGKEETGRALAFFSASIVLILTISLDLSTLYFLKPIWFFAIPVAGAALLDFSFVFPRNDPVILKYPSLRLAGYIIAMIIFLISLALSGGGQFEMSILMWQIEATVSIALGVAALLWLTIRLSRMGTTLEREQVRWVLLGSMASFCPALLWLLGTSVKSYILLSLVIFPVTTSYALIKYRLSRSGLVMRKATLYGILAILIIIGFALLSSGFSLILGTMIGINTPVILGTVLFFTALLIFPLKNSLEKALDQIYLKSSRIYQEQLETFNNEISTAVSFMEIVNKVRRLITTSLNPSSLHIFIYDPLSDQYVATLDEQNDLTSDIQFPAKSSLVQYFSENLNTLYFHDIEHILPALKPDRLKIQMLGVNLFIPLSTQNRLSGWIALGKHQFEEAYTSRQIDFLESICVQISIAFERTQIVANMEDRVRQMNVLTRIAQGINITIDLNDVLELIYAQTTQIIPAQDFEILMLDEDTIALSRIFCVENNDRILEKENTPIVETHFLEQEIIAQRKGFKTNDYSKEREERSSLPEKTGVYAWIGVPLNSGAETIGVLSLAKREPHLVFTQDQMNLLQSIADLVAGAIIKSRLLQESQSRANQLASLNELNRQLTSNLNVENLLKHILDSAVDMLNCEAGSLLMIDEETGDLVFRVVNGPASERLLNKRMPAGMGIVGRAIKNRSPMIINNVKDSPDWFSQTDEETGYQTRSAFVIPLEVKDEIIAVLEVLNKKDNTAFRREDQQLLIAYSSQAAVALENARMYTNTDQALEARIEELSMLQRIGRELNTSLETGRAMRTTLEWAMRKSSANAGLVGVIVGDGIQIMASQGYEDELMPYQDKPMPLNLVKLGNTLETGAPLRHLVDKVNPGIRKGISSQNIIPIRRESTPVGILILESFSTSLSSNDTINFLVRLTDHAAIAISNAQLFSAVRQANMAKSEFVSFVSHELKNPMTSIKGYTELISAGAVGPVNEAQLNFLKTIQSNVDRMAILVSDLADESRIEAGRLKLEFQAQKPQEVLDEVIRTMKRQVEEKNIQLVIEIAEEIPSVWADRTRLIQVLTNLVSNACKYTEANGRIHISATQGENALDKSDSSRVVHFEVADSGIGISREDQKKIFQKFFRSEDPKTREAPGTGLGLNITRSLVELQGGKIWFESEYRKGTTFHFTLPVSEI